MYIHVYTCYFIINKLNAMLNVSLSLKYSLNGQLTNKAYWDYLNM